MIPRILARPPRAPRVHAVSNPTTTLLRRHYAKPKDKQSIVDEPPHTEPILDPSFAALMNDVNMSLKRAKQGEKSYVAEKDITPVPASEQPAEVEEGEEDAQAPRRPPRRSPAAMFGTKNIGMIVLPDWLIEGVQNEVEQVDNRRIVREKYLEMLEPKKEKSDKTNSRNTEQHALARAAAFLPAQARSSRRQTALPRDSGKLRRALTKLTPRAATEELGVDAIREFTLIQRTRWGLALAERLAQPLAIDVNLDEMDFKRDISFAGLPQPPQVAMSTFMMSMLPTAQSRRDHLKQLLETDAEHIVVVDRGSTEVWEAMDAARTFLMEHSTPEHPLHITAPCPHQFTCPRAGTREACSFIQKVQRPPFLRRTKHAKRGEENITYSYLIISRGERPKSTATAGRFGVVAAELEAKKKAKATKRPELVPVEGGESGAFEVVNTAAMEYEVPPAESLDDPALVQSLREQAYSWPRLIAQPMKRSGHVVMDMCAPSGNLERRRYAKSTGKQEYYDARRTAWGDLFPHESKAKIEVRDRGIIHLKKTLSEAELIEQERDIKRKEKAKREAAKLAANTGKAPPPPLLEPAEPTQSVYAEPRTVKGKNGLAFESTGDPELDALYKQLGIAPVVAEPVMGSPEGMTEEEEMEQELERMFGTFDPPPAEPEPMPTSKRGRRQAEAELTDTGLGVQKRFMSARPAELKGRPKLTVGALQKQYASGTPISVLTAYDYPTSRLCADAEVDIILVGDSLAQVALGYQSTTELTLSEMCHHIRAVRRGSGSSFILADMPFGSFEASVEEGVKSAVELVKAGADAVKIEGGAETLPLVRRLTSFGIAVMPHIGLMPQRAASTGYRVQGKQASAALDLIQLARDFEAAGAFGLLLEAIPHQLGALITAKVGIPTIGIGAGNQTSGQVLVLTDLLGTYGFDADCKAPKFVRLYAQSGEKEADAVRQYIADVRDRSFPKTGEETYTMPEKELGELRRLVDEMD
ncbi:3-methyl-2-oxobutanoate hydroxymethyltransferase [Trichosporon asahii var. asahii CBS 2479]|uniref:3-methyl-2-oxobutanoate hydroxymethyltransferase n=1 Tax=Trichosporon asahii var. asahii (strain ATCC 90039 / CBS 2479 / JCM 2466 / KCTC 7840 / NBRC 103889/ NCYC 2677 / UAMH 7654) TaxID=1186058 RepID=J6ESN2_TRIAS|nr:3-methyl-2-oxobutanoate hydroxymethyltransferase [Trichosporon asahii var. asahii CBS 2479]EJT45757.1 3-methyl-2-oxobutanoate hydroxymethyltransferase [Trichosporon asahii var. asahii CBS 2479]